MSNPSASREYRRGARKRRSRRRKNGASVTTVPGSDRYGVLLSLGGDYGTALNALFDFKFCDYAAVLGFSMPIDNASPKAALAQAHVASDQSRLQYRQALYQAVLLVKSAFANLTAFQEQVDATTEATTYAQKRLHDTEAQYRVGAATTNTLRQFQSNLVTAQGRRVSDRRARLDRCPEWRKVSA